MTNLTRLPDRNGDECYAVSGGGTVRFNPRTSDWHAVITVRGKLKSRYHGTRISAVGWVKRHQRKGA